MVGKFILGRKLYKKIRYLKILSDSQAATKAKGNNTLITSLSVKDAINTWELVRNQLKKVALCWVKAHVAREHKE